MPPRLVALLAVVIATALVVGCGDSSNGTDGSRTGTATNVAPAPQGADDRAPVGASARICDSYATDAEALRASGIACDQARQVLYGWQREHSCGLPSAASRGSCLTRSYRCQAVRGDRGLAVSCSRPGRSLAFIAKP